MPYTTFDNNSIICVSPYFDLFLSISDGKKPVFIQTFITELAVETLNEGIV